MLVLLLGSASGAVGDEEKAGAATGTKGERPLSRQWLEIWEGAPGNFLADNGESNRLANELVASEQVATNAWSRRTEAEIQSAFDVDILLRKNSWSAARCSASGCIAAIELSPTASSGNSVILFKVHLLAYLTPRLTTSHHTDITYFETGGSPVRKYVVFFVFPDASATDGAPSRIGKYNQAKVISGAIASEMTAARDAMSKRQWVDSLVALKDAEKKEGLNAIDREQIHALAGFAYNRLHRNDEAQREYELALALAAAFSIKEAVSITRPLFYVSILNMRYLQAIELGRSLAMQDAANPKDLMMLSQAFAVEKDCEHAADWVNKSIAASQKVGENPDQMVFDLKSRCENINAMTEEREMRKGNRPSQKGQ